MASKEVRQLIKKLERQGIVVTPTKKGHYLARCPGGIVTIPGTPSDRRTLQNVTSLLRKRGADL